MSVFWEDDLTTIYVGDALDELDRLEEGSVHCVVTSPPYYGLRDYKVEARVWGGEVGCAHEWEAPVIKRNRWGKDQGVSEKQMSNRGNVWEVELGETCRKCGAWRGQLGLETILDCLSWARGEAPCAACYVCHLRAIFEKVRRVLRQDGTVFLILGDTYAGSHAGGYSSKAKPPSQWKNQKARRAHHRPGFRTPLATVPGLKPKDMCAVPWRVGLALQADGWWLRSDIIWAKPNAMPESVKDRPSKGHEYVLLLAKSSKYFFDHGDGVHLRTVWSMSAQPFKMAHFATFPERFVQRCLMAAISAHGYCPTCLSPWKRTKSSVAQATWKPTCTCPSNDARGRPVVLDPFLGSGTTLAVARQLGLKGVGIELNTDYCQMAKDRVCQSSLPLFDKGGCLAPSGKLQRGQDLRSDETSSKLQKALLARQHDRHRHTHIISQTRAK